MTTHYLKVLTEFFNKIETGEKKHEIRKDDRRFKVNDILVLQDFDEGLTGREIKKKVTYISTHNSMLLLNPGIVVMSLGDL